MSSNFLPAFPQVLGVLVLKRIWLTCASMVLSIVGIASTFASSPNLSATGLMPDPPHLMIGEQTWPAE
ncbi:hypothetical protein BDV09DRAFT_160492 [Aspergillus tetrazonus]